jgi:hypothetical protein
VSGDRSSLVAFRIRRNDFVVFANLSRPVFRDCEILGQAHPRCQAHCQLANRRQAAVEQDQRLDLVTGLVFANQG